MDILLLAQSCKRPFLAVNIPFCFRYPAIGSILHFDAPKSRRTKSKAEDSLTIFDIWLSLKVQICSLWKAQYRCSTALDVETVPLLSVKSTKHVFACIFAVCIL